MNNPLKIMNEIEREEPVFIDSSVPVGGCGVVQCECVGLLANDSSWQSLRATIEEQQAQIALLRQGLEEVAAGPCCQTEGCTPEEPYCDVNSAKQILNDSNTQSAIASFKADVLREAAAEKRKLAHAMKERLQPFSSINGEAQWLEERANRIENEAYNKGKGNAN